jgi:hypothetical protein
MHCTDELSLFGDPRSDEPQGWKSVERTMWDPTAVTTVER